MNRLKKMKSVNKAEVLNLLRLRGSLSRAELARELSLSKKTTTNLTRELLAERKIRANGYQSSNGGRKAERLELNPDYKYALGIYLGSDRMEGVVLDLKGQIREYGKLGIRTNPPAGYVFKKIGELSREMTSKFKRSDFLGTGFVFHGIMNEKRTTIISSAISPRLEGARIKNLIGKPVPVPVKLDGPTHAIALAERWFGVARDIDRFMLLELGAGIGFTLMYKDQLHYGATGSAGELGHTLAVPKGRMCRCGHRGCLETVASIPAIEREAKRRLKVPVPRNFAETNRMARNGNKTARSIISKAGDYIGIAASTLVNSLNPSHLIITGELSEAGDVLIKSIKNSLKKHTTPLSYKSLRILQGKLGRQGLPVGAATLALTGVFEPENQA